LDSKSLNIYVLNDNKHQCSLSYLYTGYSTTVGEFSGDNDFDVAVGMPKGSNLTGKVYKYSYPFSNTKQYSKIIKSITILKDL